MTPLLAALAAGIALALCGLLATFAEAYTRAARLERELTRAETRAARYRALAHRRAITPTVIYPHAGATATTPHTGSVAGPAANRKRDTA